MKKIMFFFVLSFIFIFNVNASTSKFYRGERIPDIYIRMIDGDKLGLDITHVIRREDGEFVYCVDPFIYANYSDVYTEYDYNNRVFNLTDDQLNKINIIAYYGYGYKNHTDLKWYVITQFVIWQELGIEDVYFMDSKDGNRISLYEEEINELKKMVDDYYLLPSFSNETFKYTTNNVYQIIDLNGVIENYDIKFSNIQYIIEDDKLYINTKNTGNYEITFVKKDPVDRNYLLYALNNSQPLIYPGHINEIEFKIDIEVIDGNIIINKKDSENKNREFASLNGAVYGIYKDEVLIDQIVTDENGIASLENLPLGKYKVKELKSSVGYNLDKNIYEVELTYDNKDIIINSYEEVIKGNIELNKYYGEENNYMLEDGAVFEIYDINNNLIGSYETIDGKIKEKLDYGNYYVVQTKGINGYSFIDKFNISIDKNKKYSFNLYDDIMIVDVPNTSRIDYYRLYPILFILFGVFLIFKASKKVTHS